MIVFSLFLQILISLSFNVIFGHSKCLGALLNVYGCLYVYLFSFMDEVSQFILVHMCHIYLIFSVWVKMCQLCSSLKNETKGVSCTISEIHYNCVSVITPDKNILLILRLNIRINFCTVWYVCICKLIKSYKVLGTSMKHTQILYFYAIYCFRILYTQYISKLNKLFHKTIKNHIGLTLYKPLSYNTHTLNYVSSSYVTCNTNTYTQLQKLYSYYYYTALISHVRLNINSQLQKFYANNKQYLSCYLSIVAYFVTHIGNSYLCHWLRHHGMFCYCCYTSIPTYIHLSDLHYVKMEDTPNLDNATPNYNSLQRYVDVLLYFNFHFRRYK